MDQFEPYEEWKPTADTSELEERVEKLAKIVKLQQDQINLLRELATNMLEREKVASQLLVANVHQIQLLTAFAQCFR